METAKGEISNPQAFIDTYDPDAVVAFGNGTQMTLGQALQFERLMCPADAAKRQEPARRISKLAGMLAAGGSLRAEDEHYLTQPE